MRRFIKHIVLFIPLVILSYVVLVILWGSFVAPSYLKKNLNYKRGLYGHMFSRLQEVEQTRDVDIVFIGSSHAYRGFDTRIFEEVGFKSFNLGSSSQTPIQSHYLLERYMETLNPKMIVYEINPDIFESDGVESTLDLLSNASFDRSLLTMAVNNKDIRVINTAIFAYFRAVIDTDQYREDRRQGPDRYISGGYVERDLIADKPLSFTRKHGEVNSRQWKTFKRLMISLEERDVPVILVQAPVKESYYRGYTDVQLFDQQMTDYGDYYNFNTSRAYSDELFYDDQHLNRIGVRRFNNELIALLKNKGQN